MATTLAIYEALIEANVPPIAARRAAEALEEDMTTHLATKADVAVIGQRFDAVDVRFGAVDRRFDAVYARFDAIDARFASVDRRFDAVDARFASVEARIEALEIKMEQRFATVDRELTLKLENLESRLIIRLGALMVVIVGAASALTNLFG